MKYKIAILTNVMPSYLEGFYKHLISNKNYQFTFFCQSNISGMSINCIHKKFPLNHKLIKFISLKEEKFTLQFLPIFYLWNSFDIYIINGNPRQMSHFIIATLFNLLGKKVILHTMAHSFNNVSITETLRLNWTKYFNNIIVYNDMEVRYLYDKGFKNSKIWGINNALDQESIQFAKTNWTFEILNKWQLERKISDRNVIISCARLIKKNKFELIVDSLFLLKEQIENILWIVIGDGEERLNLEEKVKIKGLNNNVLFIGKVYDINKLAPWLLSASFFVHPGAIGLSILQAFGFGLPVIVNDRRELNGPEYSYFEEGKTGLSFINDNYHDLFLKMLKLFANRELCSQMSIYVTELATNKYNAKNMTTRYLDAIDYVLCQGKK